MLLRMKINPRRKSQGYYADEIEVPNACDREKASNRINSISAVDLLHFNGQTAKICVVFRFDRLIFNIVFRSRYVRSFTLGGNKIQKGRH